MAELERDHGEWGCERECLTGLGESVVADCIKMVICEQSMGSVAGDSGPAEPVHDLRLRWAWQAQGIAERTIWESLKI